MPPMTMHRRKARFLLLSCEDETVENTIDFHSVRYHRIYINAVVINAKFDGAHSPIDQVMLKVAPIGELVGFYRMGFSLPVLKFNRQI